MIDRRLPSISAWVDAYRDALIPVLPGTLADLHQFRDIEERTGSVDAHTLSEAFSHDPLMTLDVLKRVARHCRSSGAEPPETLVGAIVMLGIGPFFRAYEQPVSILDWLHEHPAATSGLLKVITRGRRASRFAVNFALRRQDEDALIIQEAALLHDFAEMLMWCHAPALMQQVSDQLNADHRLRSKDVQQDVLGISLDDLAIQLMQQWSLPPLLIECTDDRLAHHPRIRTTTLAVRLARHSQHGWDDPHAQAAWPDDIADVAALINLSKDATWRLIQDIDG
ncbi:HDOD domain-containing protein [Aquabacterium sp. A3]|uniref:HDOD domain-containing protein n=1 Tax=Aquabacterium sp. A3 TaxID=3132829 RepID=UPI0031196461